MSFPGARRGASLIARVPLWLWDAYFISVILLLGLRVTSGFSGTVELHPHDESMYHALARKGETLAGWSPLYVLFLRAYPALGISAWDGYYLNLVVLTVALALCAYGILRRIGVGPGLAFLPAVFFLLAEANGPLTPKANHFNIIYLSLCFLFSSFLRPFRAEALFLLLVPSLYARLDNAFTLLLVGVYVIASNLRRGGKRSVLCLAVTFLCACLFFMRLQEFLSSPFEKPRIWLAFLDHLYWQSDHSVSLERFRTSLFGQSQGLWQALQTNPAPILRHGFGNLKGAAVEVFASYVYLRPLFGWINNGYIQATVNTALFGLILSLAGRRGRLPRLSWSEKDENLVILLLVLCCSLLLQSVVNLFFLSPFPRYFLELWFFLPLLLFARICQMPILERLLPHGILTVPVLFALLVLAPPLRERPLFNRLEESATYGERPYARLCQEVNRSLVNRPWGDQAGCVAFGAYGIFLDGFECSRPSSEVAQKQEDFLAYLKTQEIKLLIADRNLQEWVKAQGGFDLVQLIEANKDRLGWVSVPVSSREFNVEFRVFGARELFSPKADVARK